MKSIQIFRSLRRRFEFNNGTTLIQSIILWVVPLTCLFAIVCPLALYVSNILPNVQTRTIPKHLFSEERARDYFSNLTAHGPRVINTRADYLVREFLIAEIERIRSTAVSNIQFDIDLQNFTTLDIEQLQNIMVRVRNPSSPLDRPCLMLAAHYDSVEFSFGGSDDGSGVVTLLEIFSNLIHDPTIEFDQVHLIVLFTSAEELSLGGAAAFTANHPWKQNVRRFINLDSTGSQGKSILFRVKPSQIIIDYGKVPRPHANVIGDEILELLGRDTDFSEFSKRGSLPGYDVAFYLDGYRYHTILDRPSAVTQGALQHLGDNILTLSRESLSGKLDLQELLPNVTDDRVVYFDLIGQHLITYQMSTVFIVQLTLIGLILLIGLLTTVLDHIWQTHHSLSTDKSSIYYYLNSATILRLCYILLFTFSYLISLVVGIVFSITVGYIMSKVRPLSWFGNPALAIFLFGLPCLIGIVLSEKVWHIIYRIILSYFLKKYKKNMEKVDIDIIHRQIFDFERHYAVLVIHVALMVISIYLGYRSLYIIHIWSIFVCPLYLLLILIQFGLRWKQCKLVMIFGQSHWYWGFIPYISSILPLLHSLEMTTRLLRMAIPMLGRMFQNLPVPRDVVISIVVAGFAVLFFLVLIPNMQRTLYFGRSLILLGVVFLIVFIYAATRNPFTSSHPKVLIVRHESISMYKIELRGSVPQIVSSSTQSPWISIESHDGIDLSPILESFSRKTGHILENQICKTKTNCTFDDSFNRTTAFKGIRFLSTDNAHYKFVVSHLTVYNIQVISTETNYIHVENSSTQPREETIITVQNHLQTKNFTIEMSIQRCNLDDSPFLMALTRVLPYVTLWGRGRCQAIVDQLSIVFVTE